MNEFTSTPGTNPSDYVPFEGLRKISFCPFCASSYDPGKATSLYRLDDLRLLLNPCWRCHVSVLARITESKAGVSVTELVTDLVACDVLRIVDGGLEDVTEDDVIDVHALLEEDDKDFIDAVLDTL